MFFGAFSQNVTIYATYKEDRPTSFTIILGHHMVPPKAGYIQHQVAKLIAFQVSPTLEAVFHMGLGRGFSVESIWHTRGGLSYVIVYFKSFFVNVI